MIKQWLALVLGIILMPTSYAAVWQITYPRSLVEGDVRNEYPMALLSLALDKTGVRYELKPSDRIMLQGKSIRQLRENREINILWSMTDEQRENELLPIRVPIHKGLIGFRVFLVHRDNVNKFKGLDNLAALKRFIPVQVEDWPDTKILQYNGFNVETSPNYIDAFDMVARYQSDFFPRSVVEVLNELKMDSISRDIVLEPTLAIRYPTAMYFFTSKANPTLAKLIETGLLRAVEDGSFDTLFTSYYADILSQLDVDHRNVFELDNPLISDATPLDNRAFWFDTNSLRSPTP